MSSQATQPRKIVFIKKEFQARFVLRVLVLIALFGVISAALIFALTGGDLEAQANSAHVSIAAVRDRLALTIMLCTVVAAVGAGALAVYVVIYATHRIAGPLYRFETLCRQITEGRFDGVTHLRDKDELQDLATAFAAMVDALRARRDERQRVVTALDAQLQGLGGAADEVRAQLRQLADLS